MGNLLIIFFFAIWTSFLLTAWLRNYTRAKKLIDIPNKRSSHSIPTPRGGGVAVIITFSIFLIVLVYRNFVSFHTLLPFLCSGFLVAIIGCLDDLRDIAVSQRLLTHFIAAICGLFFLGGMPPLTISNEVIYFSWSGHIVAIIYLVWLLNLYNFMDGIDGIASIEAITVCIGMIVLYILFDADNDNVILFLLLLAAILGFLPWNFPKARIFMGDAGSGFIGIILGLLSIQAAWVSSSLFYGMVILLGMFVVDSTVTLIRRIWRRQKFYHPHRNHAYQYASRKYNSHIIVSIFFAIINLCWLFPIALIVVNGWINGIIGIILAYLPLIWLAFVFKAGAENDK